MLARGLAPGLADRCWFGFGKRRILEVLLERHGTLGVLIAGFSPIPYKVMGWAAGMGKMEMRPFVWAGVVSRGLRFGLEIVLVVRYGNAALDAIGWILDREILLAVAMLGIPDP